MANNKKTKKKKGIILNLLIAICLCIFAFSGYKLVSYYLEYKKMDSVYANINEKALGNFEYEPDSEGLLKKAPKIDIEALKSINDEIIGYILIPNTKIEYPLLHSNEPYKYLNNDASGNPSRAGAIFIDANNDTQFQDDNTIIYGHNMYDGSMFGELSEYLDDNDFFLEHSYIYIYTENEIRLYRVFSAMATIDGSDIYTINFPDNGELQGHAQVNAINSLQRIKNMPENVDSIITLSTCRESSGDARNVVLAYLVDVLPND